MLNQYTNLYRKSTVDRWRFSMSRDDHMWTFGELNLDTGNNMLFQWMWARSNRQKTLFSLEFICDSSYNFRYVNEWKKLFMLLLKKRGWGANEKVNFSRIQKSLTLRGIRRKKESQICSCDFRNSRNHRLYSNCLIWITRVQNYYIRNIWYTNTNINITYVHVHLGIWHDNIRDSAFLGYKKFEEHLIYEPHKHISEFESFHKLSFFSAFCFCADATQNVQSFFL